MAAVMISVFSVAGILILLSDLKAFYATHALILRKTHHRHDPTRMGIAVPWSYHYPMSLLQITSVNAKSRSYPSTCRSSPIVPPSVFPFGRRAHDVVRIRRGPAQMRNGQIHQRR